MGEGKGDVGTQRARWARRGKGASHPVWDSMLNFQVLGFKLLASVLWRSWTRCARGAAPVLSKARDAAMGGRSAGRANLGSRRIGRETVANGCAVRKPAKSSCEFLSLFAFSYNLQLPGESTVSPRNSYVRKGNACESLSECNSN